jgi:hypothetical protein
MDTFYRCCCLFGLVVFFLYLLREIEMVLNEIDQQFLNFYSGNIAECKESVLIDFLYNPIFSGNSEHYSHLMDTYIAFKAGIEFSNKMKGLTQ